MLRNWIQSDQFIPGEALPSERVLAEHFGIGRGVIRGALRILEKEGVIRSEGLRTRLIVETAKSSNLLESTIVVVTPRTEPVSGHNSTGWSEFLAQGAIRQIRQSSYDVLILNPERLNDSTLTKLISNPPMGVIIPETGNGLVHIEIAHQFQDHGIAVVTYGGHQGAVQFDRVISDHEGGSYELTKWLIARGRKRILNIWPATDTTYWLTARQAGYERAMHEAGLEPRKPLVIPKTPNTDYQPKSFELDSRILAGYFIDHLMGSEPADALQIWTDGAVNRAARAVRLCHKIPNQDVDLVGYDNYWHDVEERKYEDTPPLATIDKRNEVMGEEMVKLLLDRKSGKLGPEPHVRKITGKLIVLEV